MAGRIPNSKRQGGPDTGIVLYTPFRVSVACIRSPAKLPEFGNPVKQLVECIEGEVKTRPIGQGLNTLGNHRTQKQRRYVENDPIFP